MTPEDYIKTQVMYPYQRLRLAYIHALGIMLLEIAIGKPIDTSVIPGDHDYEAKESLAALKVGKEGVVAHALGCSYADIVSKCLLFKFDGVESDLRREELQRAFYEDAV
ncbi:hypothetical protein K458DRAFT_387553 [Lentithecium fluviatile CBS 122367]|uniref:Protein kinase domain-containing protein n=1 Tax=Lentithecium fluviatile CBS 122367 TaxID=1168545 RepID=A0A6G1J4X9_9PLEO|nr:hypothetical protein K458DRAFT_387553 [Lentithecium fluviatile CBS 122367]